MVYRLIRHGFQIDHSMYQNQNKNENKIKEKKKTKKDVHLYVELFPTKM